MRSRRLLVLRAVLVVLAAAAMALFVGWARYRARQAEADRLYDEQYARDKAAAEADPANDRRPLDAPPWTANPYEAQPVTHLRQVHLTSVTDPAGAEQAATDRAAHILGVTVAGDRPVLFSCGWSQPLGPGFTRLRRIKTFDKDTIDPCDDPYLRDPRGGPLVFLLTRGGYQLIAFDVVAHRLAWHTHVPPVTRDPKNDLANMVLGSAMFAGGRIVLRREADDAVIALDPATGAIAWVRETARVSALASDGASVFVLDPGAKLTALEPATGAARWTTPLADFPSSPTLSLAAGGGKVALTSQGKLVVLDAGSGQLVVAATLAAFAPALGPTELLFQQGELYAYANQALMRLDPTKGTPLWSIPGYFDTPVRGRDALFAVRAHHQEDHVSRAGDPVDGVIHAFDPLTGTEVWSYGAKIGTTPLERETLSLLEVQGSEILVMNEHGHSELTFFQRGPDALPEKETTLDVSYPEGPDGAMLEIGGDELPFDQQHHWQGKRRGRGNLWLTATPQKFGSPGYTLVSLDDAGPTTSVELKLHAFHQACAGE